MRMLVFFDLPVVTKAERRAYTLFRRFLLNDGYDMIQFSVYGRILNGSDAVDKHMKRLLANLPPEGSVRAACWPADRCRLCRFADSTNCTMLSPLYSLNVGLMPASTHAR